MSFLTTWQLHSKSEARRLRAVKTLAAEGPSAIDQLLVVLARDPSGSVRSAAASALGTLKDARAVEPLISALSDTDVAASAAWALGMIGDDRCWDDLIALAHNFGQDWRTTERVLDAIETIGYQLEVKRLLPLLSAVYISGRVTNILRDRLRLTPHSITDDALRSIASASGLVGSETRERRGWDSNPHLDHYDKDGMFLGFDRAMNHRGDVIDRYEPVTVNYDNELRKLAVAELEYRRRSGISL